MLVSFTLSMPNRRSWNDGWSGEERVYAIIKNFRGKKAEAKAENILKEESYSYNFGDGWGASISVEKIDGQQSSKLRRKIQGFCGYDWMVQSILLYGEIKHINNFT